MPIAIAAIVIVIRSRGMLKIPIIPRINNEGRVLGIKASTDKLNDLNINKNITNIIAKTTMIVFIWELNRL